MRRGWGMGGRTLTPARLSNVVLWLKADRGITTAGAGDGGGVSAWADQSGYGRHATQAVSSARPTIGTGASGVGGKPALVFDGVNDSMATADMLPWSGSAPRTVFAVYRPIGVSNPGSVVFAGKEVAFDAWSFKSQTLPVGSDPQAVIYDGIDHFTSHTRQTSPLLAEVSYNGSTVRVAKNAFAYESFNPLSPLVTDGAQPFRIAARSSSAYFLGAIPEIICMASQARADEVARARAYLGAEYGISM